MLAPALFVVALTISTLATDAAQDEPAAPAPALLAYAGEPGAIRVAYEGEYVLEAHCARPHATRTYGTRMIFVAQAGGRARLDWETWPVGRADKRDVETTLVDGTHVWHRADAAKPFVKMNGKSAALLRARLEAGLPWLTLARVRSATERCTTTGSSEFSWTEAPLDGGIARHFARDPATNRLLSISRVFAHPRLGDARDEITYGAWQERDGITVPVSFEIREFEGEDALRFSPATFTVRLAKLEAGIDVAHELEIPKEAQPAGAPAPALAPAVTVLELEPGVCSFLAQELQGRTITVEFADHLVAIDAPLSSALGERIVAAIRDRYPAKPVRYVTFGHYHPHYTGGLRAFLAAGATVVAPEGCAAFAAEIAARPFTIEPDAWARSGKKAVIESFRARRVFEDATRRLELIDIGTKSSHTDEYLLFYLPRTHTVLQDDVGWFAAADGALRFGQGSRGLYEAIREQKLDVKKLWQSWPVDHARPSISFAELETGVLALR
jgi:glyoxylase-like metal-dependent hydrolase (beta-lactamase superfamily II)